MQILRLPDNYSVFCHRQFINTWTMFPSRTLFLLPGNKDMHLSKSVVVPAGPSMSKCLEKVSRNCINSLIDELTNKLFAFEF